MVCIVFERAGHGLHVEAQARIANDDNQLSSGVESNRALHLLARIVLAPLAHRVCQRPLDGEFAAPAILNCIDVRSIIVFLRKRLAALYSLANFSIVEDQSKNFDKGRTRAIPYY
jgi:hypothetical protein